MIIIGYYTTDSVYESCFELLEKSLIRAGHRYSFKAIPPSDWKSATDLKPKIVLEQLEQFQEPVLYLDVDAFVHENLDQYFADKDCDIAVNYLRKKTGEEELLSGTVYFAYSEKVLSLVRAWKEVGENNPLLNDQQALQQAVQEFEDELKVYRLSAAFTYIFDRVYEDVKRPVIEHLQASREIYCRNDMKTLKNRLKKFMGLKVHKAELLKRRHQRVAELNKVFLDV
ncbi:putative nucleotide-diphospho-sugar transferase [uncultured Amphritea sp.]|uniref:putative nucleotide-diphospho-sugar transferase n=1 Tax=uncultured Amphritea sp. TaxID=981605 RepID=UPI0026081BC4|nr:putative nucleotide-diphospho-sugar transferase [uncultured Amphritea sp.]